MVLWLLSFQIRIIKIDMNKKTRNYCLFSIKKRKRKKESPFNIIITRKSNNLRELDNWIDYAREKHITLDALYL